MASKVEDKIKPVAVGDKIILALCRGKRAVGEVTRVGKNGFIDLTAELPDGTEIIVTSSPRDDTGDRPDSWRPFVAD